MTVKLQFTKQQVKAWFKLLSETRKELSVARYDHENHRLVFTDGRILLEVPTEGWDNQFTEDGMIQQIGFKLWCWRHHEPKYINIVELMEMVEPTEMGFPDWKVAVNRFYTQPATSAFLDGKLINKLDKCFEDMIVKTTMNNEMIVMEHIDSDMKLYIMGVTKH